MEKFTNFVIRYRWAIVIFIPVIVLLSSLNLKHLEFEGSYRIWFDEDSTIIKDYDYFRFTFGNDDVITIAFRDENGIFNHKALKVIEKITQDLWKTEYVARVDSLTNYQYVHASKEDKDDILVEDFIEDIDTLSPKELKEKEQIAINEELIVGKIISKDAKTTQIVARLIPNAGEDADSSLKLHKYASDIVAQFSQSGYQFYLNGGPIVNTSFITIASNDGATFTPLIIIFTMILLYFIYKRASFMFATIGIVVFTFLIVLSVQIFLGYKLNNFTANMPVFVIAIGIADAMHIFWIYKIAREKGLNNIDAIHYTLKKNFIAILFTSLTTAVGFASLSISHVVPIKTLGIATASASLLAFVLTIFFIPAFLAILNPHIEPKESNTHESSFSRFYGEFIVKHDTKILLATLGFFLFLGYGITQVRVDSNTVRYFKEDVAFRQSVNFLQKNLTGPMSYEIVIDSGKQNGIKDPRFLKRVEEFYKEYQKEFSSIRHISSLLDVIKKFNFVINRADTIPENQNLIAQYLLLYSLSLPQGMEINDKMDIKERLLRVSASVDVVDTSKDLQMIRWAEGWWAKTPYPAKVNGQTAMFAYMQSDVTDTLINSISIAIVVVSIMMLFIFKQIKVLPLLILPNVLPIILVLGVMGWLHIDIDLGVAVAGAIIIGVAVDDTIHFLVKYFEAKRNRLSESESFSYVLRYAGEAIIFTTIILSSAFLIFIWSQFYPNYHFGIVTASALVIAMVADLLMLPAIFSKLKKFKG